MLQNPNLKKKNSDQVLIAFQLNSSDHQVKEDPPGKGRPIYHSASWHSGLFIQKHIISSQTLYI